MGDILSSLRTWRALRNPMVAIGTFRTHDDNQARQNAEIDRERRRQEVIQLALKRRQQREAKRQANTGPNSIPGSEESKRMKELPKVDMREIILKVEC